MNNANDKDNLNELDMLEDLKDFENYDLIDDTDDLLALINNQNNDYDMKSEHRDSETSNLESKALDEVSKNDQGIHQEDDSIFSLDSLFDSMEESGYQEEIPDFDKMESKSNDKDLVNGQGSDQMDKNNDDELFNILDKMLQEEEETKVEEKQITDDLSDNEDYLSFFNDELNDFEKSENSDATASSDTTTSSDINILDSSYAFSEDTMENNFSDPFNEASSLNASDNIFSIDDLMVNEEKDAKIDKAPNDISNVFSDVLSAVSSLDDPEEDDLSYLIPDINEVKNQKKKTMLNEINDTSSSKDVTSNESKKGLFSKMFHNIKDENEEDYVARAKAENEEAEKKAQEKLQKAKELKEAKKKKTVERKEVKKKQNSESAAAKKEANAAKAKLKAEKKAKEAEEAVYEYQGKINKVGASIVACFFCILAIVVVVGTNIFSYHSSVSNAEEYLFKQHYTKAYNELNGLALKEQDKELYERVKTIMYVNKELESYNNFYTMKKYPEALDSLLKGLVKYDTYVKTAKKIGVKNDLDSIKEQIVAELNDEFKLSENEADKLNKIEDKEEYGQSVYDIASLKSAENKVSSNK